MADRAFDDATWVPGEPQDPSRTTMPLPEISERLLYIERALNALKTGDLPMAGLMKTLEQNWLPDPSTLFPSGSIGFDSLKYTDYYGQVGSGGTIILGASGNWKVTRNSAGNYTVTFPTFHNVPIVVATPAVVTTSFRVTNKTVSSFDAIANVDTDFDFIVRGK